MNKESLNATEGVPLRDVTVWPRCRLNDTAMPPRRLLIPASLILLALAVLVHESGTRAHAHPAKHCGFCTSIEAGLSCE